MTFREIIQMAGELRPHSLSELVLFRWLIALDGKLAAAVFLMSPEDFRQRGCAYPAGLDNEPLVTYPHQDMYVQYLIAQIDLALGENEQYQNDMAVYNESYSAFVRWFGNMYSPGKGYGKGCKCGCGPDGNPPFYITAYALAVQQGYEGSLEDWLASLHGSSVELRVVGSEMQYRSVPRNEPPGEWILLCDLSAYTLDLYNRLRQVAEEMDALIQDVADLKYMPISFVGVTIGLGGTPGKSDTLIAEKGSTIQRVCVDWELNKIPKTLTLDGSEQPAEATGAVLGDLALTEDTAFTVEATDERDATAQAKAYLKFLNGVYCGVIADGAAIDSIAVLSLQKSLQGGRSKSFTVSPADGERLTYALPSSYGTPTFKIGGFEYAWNKAATIEFTNMYGFEASYDIWQHAQIIEGSVTVNVS